jgi:cytochrome P450
MASLIYYLACNPECQSKAREEVLSIMETDEEPTVQLLQRMPYLNACVREALRVNTPVSYIVPRISLAPIRLGRYTIPAHTSIICNVYAIHHQQAVWTEPLRFMPERFMQASSSKTLEDSWVPFVSGPRQCPARNFAMYELRTVGAMLLREYQWALPGGSIHAGGIRNKFSPFALCLPYDLGIEFRQRKEEAAVVG